MMRKVLLFLLLTSLTNVNAIGQQNLETDVKSTIDQLFDGMRANDSLLLREALHKDCTLQTVLNDKDGNVIIDSGDINEFIKAVGTKREGVQLDERLSGYDIKIDGDMATAWTPYSFFVNNNFSHCGVNAFTLVRQDSKWQILGIIDTRRKTNCD